ncbi:EAL domain-containing protein [Leptolyngbya cf. ectocarpi LEGE 11479]|uniref:EAL domain-containing protein n=1 Tax=Leptolyngbya cf. ectocarpi LEGE 11479 TaxID=1828722 RepID=A0A929FAP1_LEPEC|nr:EAL domain-containing protein [Leptolyngbya ectocarpi]MBE9070116.1 EAL domain-containing protein [Leptolyngbya cf. ectocarpi LEGE 11479]
MAKLALLIGVSEYQEGLSTLPAAAQDIRAVEKVLNNSEMGGFDHIKVCHNPDLQEMQLEIETLFIGRQKDDLVLLYFSGHGIKDENNNLYFATRNTCKNQSGELRRATAVPARFVHDIMNDSRAKRQAIILDCCFSGAFDPSLKAKDDGSFNLKKQLGAEGRVVLASSSSTQYSYEQKEENLSVYTRYLVEGIETGKGDSDGDGRVSILDLHKYATQKVQERLPKVTPKIIVLKDTGFEIVLSQVEASKRVKQDISCTHIPKLEGIQLEKTRQKASTYAVIPSLIQSLTPFVERLVEHLNSYHLARQQDTSPVDKKDFKNSVLELLRLASDADFIFSMYSPHGESSWTLNAQSKLESSCDPTAYSDFLTSQVLAAVSTEAIFTTGHHGIYRFFLDERTGITKAFILIPIVSSDDTEFIAVCGLSQESQWLNDVFARVVSSFYVVSQDTDWNPSKVEALILDDLKRAYGFLPIGFYNRRFELFCERLAEIVIYFEPILDLRQVTIKGWEALARDPCTLNAPIDLFQAAELWGRKFTVELDVGLLRRAAKSYRQASAEAQQNRSHEITPLSVNVYPESLMRTVYFETVREITTPDDYGYTLLPADNLVLEISEKAELPKYQDGMRVRSPLKAFRDRLVRYTQELEVKFGIDDFGVGYASVARLASLNPPHVKIDRDILHQQQAEVIIRFVREIVAQSSKLYSAKIIVEGLDEQSPISLQRLKQLGVAYAQGYSIGRAAPQIYRLTEERREALRKMIV